MAEYKNFVKDFPSRCKELLNEYNKIEKGKGLEVTYLISIASTALHFPFERLKISKPPSLTCLRCGYVEDKPDMTHPMGDRERHEDAANQLDALFKEKLLSSCLWDKTFGTWYRKDRLKSVLGNPNQWPEVIDPTPVGPNIEVGSTLKHIRNALAHGNIATLGHPIEYIIFISESPSHRGEFKYLMVSPTDFSKFLYKWFEFIEKLKLSPEYTLGVDEE